MKKLLSLILALALLLACVPAAAAATAEVTVYLSVSKDRDFKTINGKTMALYELTGPYFDLALYGLEKFYYNPDCYAGGTKESQKPGTAQTAKGNITMLHLYIYATEVLYHGLEESKAGKGWLADQGGWQGFSVGGDRAGSSYCVFWEFGNDANYYLNYEYPLGRPDWGASCDQILLQSGDVVSVRYTYYPKTDGTYYHFGREPESWLTADRGARVTLELYTAECEFENGRETYHNPVTAPADIYVTKDKAPVSHGALTKVGTTDSSGKFQLDTSSLEPGLYYVTANTWDPAVAVLEIFEKEEPAVVYGDLTGDGTVNVFDAAQVYQIANGKKQPTQAQELAADVNGDGEISVFDAALIYAYVNGKRSSFPVESK